jgi:PAS domain S-box-containing protein
MQVEVKYRFRIITSCLLIIFYFSSTSLNSQTISDNLVKAGYINNFIKYFTWARPNPSDTFRIDFLGDDESFFKAIKSIEALHTYPFPISVGRVSSLKDIIPVQIFVLGNDKKQFVKDVLEIIEANNTLLITDRCEYQRYVMLNFIYSENSKITFEINSNNIQDVGLVTSPKLVVLGGSEIDVRKLYVETEKSLISEKVKTEQYEKELARKKEELGTASEKLLRLQHDYSSLQNKIDIQKNELERLSIETYEQQKAIDLKNRALNGKQDSINKQNNEIRSKIKLVNIKQKQIEEYTKVLNYQNLEISRRQNIIESQGKTAITQLTRIKTQQSILYLFIALFSLLLILAFVIFRSYQLNRRRKLQLEKINIELEKLSIVASKTDNAIAIMDAEGTFEWINDGFKRLYGFTFNELINNKGKNLLLASDYDDINDILQQLKIEKKSVTYETAAISKEGNKIWVHSTLTPILDENNEIKKLIVIDSNITILKEAELAILEKNEKIQHQSKELYEQAESLLALNQELELKKNKLEEALKKLKNTQSQLVESEKMVVLGQLTAGIAHEINNPINYINSGIDGLSMAFSNLLELIHKYEQITPINVAMVLKDVEKYKEDIEFIELLKDIEMLTRDIKGGVNRTIEIVRGLRTFSRIDESDFKTIDLHGNIESTLIILRNKYINRIEIDKQFGKIPEIECYPGKINQVLLNIIVNAIQAINGQGKISIRTMLRKRSNAEFVVLEIEDSGCGMSEDVRKKVFEPFFTTKDVGEGTGLGLSISKSIIDSHKGTIEVESEIGKGTKFIVTLPTILKKNTIPTPIFEKQ